MVERSSKLTALVTDNGLKLQGTLINFHPEVLIIQTLLGGCWRIDDSLPSAPVGHRNPVFHISDELGVILLENHISQLVTTVTFVFDTEKAHKRIAHAFDGHLKIHESKLSKDTIERDLVGIGFTRFLPGVFVNDWGCCSVHAETVPVTKGSRCKVLSEVSVDLPPV